VSTTLLTGMTGISLHMQWPPTSQLHGSFHKDNYCLFVTDQTLMRLGVSPPSFDTGRVIEGYVAWI
jgi:hypothetical protein